VKITDSSIENRTKTHCQLKGLTVQHVIYLGLL